MLKNKVQQSKFEDLTGFIKWFMTQTASCLAIKRALQEVVQNREFLSEEGWGQRIIYKKKEELFLDQGIFLWGKRPRTVRRKIFYYTDWLLFLWGMKRAHIIIILLVLTQNFQTLWLRLHFWERLKKQLGQLWNLFGIMVFSTSDLCGFLL